MSSSIFRYDLAVAADSAMTSSTISSLTELDAGWLPKATS